MKVLKRICALAFAVAIALTPVAPVKAAEASEGAEAAKQGVVQVNTVIVGNDAEKHVVIGGAGFIIGDAEGTEYVITSKHIVSPDQDTLKAACDFYGLIGNEKSMDVKISTEVVIESDVVLTASVLTSSSELDMVVLQLPQPIYTRTPLKLLTNKKYDVNDLPYAAGDSVFAVGFPEMISYDAPTHYYSDQQVQMEAGEIKNLTSYEGIQVIESDVATDFNNFGGPLVDSNGYVIGMNLPLYDEGSSCALDSTKIAKILDGLGVSYTQVNSTPKVEEEPVVEEETEAAAEVEAAPTPEAKAKKGMSETMIIVISLIAVFVVACGVACLILFVINKDKNGEPKAKKDKKAKKTYNGPVFDMDNNSVKMTGASGMPQRQPSMPKSMAPSQSFRSEETTILSAMPTNNDGETSLLSEDLSAPQNLGTLIRKRTSERITLNKSNFVIGKDALHSDYCIEKNSSISRKHAMITSGRNGVYIQDCNSTNGTFINGTKLESERSVLMNSGDVIKLSNEEFEYQA
ncbi:MAG: FHA domain-containing protein [Pseudobutyrivibrio sp.]|nr:FHA domain-containing protein [Pseudobutyrivibrio sp.]